RRRDHLDVDAGVGERGEEAGRDARVRAHARADERELAAVVVVEQLGEADLVLYPFEGGEGGRAVSGREGDRDVRAAGATGRDVLHDHVDIDLGRGELAEDRGRLARLVRHVDDRHLDLAAVVRDAADDRLLHG